MLKTTSRSKSKFPQCHSWDVPSCWETEGRSKWHNLLDTKFATEFCSYQLNNYRQPTPSLALHPSGVHFPRLPKTDVLRAFFPAPPSWPHSEEPPPPRFEEKKLCQTIFQLSLKWKAAYGDGLVWVLSFQRNAFRTFLIGLHMKGGMSLRRGSRGE